MRSGGGESGGRIIRCPLASTTALDCQNLRRAVIGVAAVVWFRNDPPTGDSRASAAGLQAELSLPLGGDRLLSFYLGRIAVPGTSLPAHAPSVSDEVGAPAPPVSETRAAPPPLASLSATAVSAAQRTAERSEFCMMGNGVVSRRSFALGDVETVSAYGPADGIDGNHPQLNTSPGFALAASAAGQGRGQTGWHAASGVDDAGRALAEHPVHR